MFIELKAIKANEIKEKLDYIEKEEDNYYIESITNFKEKKRN